MTKELPLCKCGCGNQVRYPWNKYINHHYGKNGFTEEHKRKIGEGNKGKIISEETKKKMSNVRKGRKLSEEHKKNLSIAKKI